VPGLPFVDAVALGEYHLLIVTRSGELYSCGRNDYHQLGYDGASVSTPIKIGKSNLNKPRLTFFVFPHF
jgi:alpha-tubulin suppressor-like RCC1 family protein